jgi:hypothetical protein
VIAGSGNDVDDASRMTASLPLLRYCVAALLASCASHRHASARDTERKGHVWLPRWFNAEGDGANRGYNHWARGGARPGPGRVTVDLWPDLSELAPDERFPTDFVHADGRPAEVFSSYRRPTVLRHFSWMAEHGIDGVFVQRFINSLARPSALAHNNTVLTHCREGARLHGRTYALMYDLSSLAPGQADRLIEDWKQLLRDTRLTRDPAYLRHRGKPLLALWGCGFPDNDKPRPSLEDWRKILTFLKQDPECGGLSIMLGVPSFWREQRRDAIKDPALHEILQMADVISPWTPGRYRTPEAATQHARDTWQPDLVWCRERNIDYLPVAFPGFSCIISKATRSMRSRLQGRFFWSQVVALGAGAKCSMSRCSTKSTKAPLISAHQSPARWPGVSFPTYEGLPSDYFRPHRTGRQSDPWRTACDRRAALATVTHP